MADKKALTKKKKPNIAVRFGRGFIRFFTRIINSFRNTFRELKKVTWPTRDKLVNYSVIVMLFMLFMMIVIGLLDTGATELVRWIVGLGSATTGV